MPHDDLNFQQDQPQPHRHNCGSLFGCGEEQGTGVFREDIKDAAFTKPGRGPGFLHMDEMNQEQLDGYLNARGVSRRRLLRASGFMAALAGIGPWFNKLAYAKSADMADGFGGRSGRSAQERQEK